MNTFADAIDRFLDGLQNLARWLVIPLFLLLALQWPLREFVQHYSREANDRGQVLFALYAAVAVTAATRAGAHLAADAVARRYSARVRRALSRTCAALVLAPFAIFVAASGRALVMNSVGQLERFGDTGNPGYFAVKLALWLLAFCMAAAALAEILRWGVVKYDAR